MIAMDLQLVLMAITSHFILLPVIWWNMILMVTVMFLFLIEFQTLLK